MRRFLKIIGIVLAAVLLLIIVGVGILSMRLSKASKANLAMLGEEAPTLMASGHAYRDLNKNGQLDPYEDARVSVDERVDDLVSQMNLVEKAGMMFISMIGVRPGGSTVEGLVLAPDPMLLMMSLMMPSGSEMIAAKKLNSFNYMSSEDPESLAKFNNAVQKMAERTRLGIPVTLASDPRHGSEYNPGLSIAFPAFSAWPGFLGLAAMRDTQLVREFGDIARQEYRAVGLRLALHPMADLCTEPRWGRTNGTFGEDAHLAAETVRAYVRGFQGDSLSHNSVACMTKHFPGSGTHTEGHETHFAYGKEQSYTGDNFAYQVIPFSEGGLAAGTAQIMLSYGIPMGQTSEDVAVAFNRDMVTHLLRDSLKFDGVICTDWNVITDSRFSDFLKGGSSSWGVENLTPMERVKKAIDAGVDQFGGEFVPELIVQLVAEGKVQESRLDQSVRRILRDKFIMGLFDDPYIDPTESTKIAGRADFVAKGEEAQRKSVVLLKNEDRLLPLKPGTKVFVDGFRHPEVFEEYGALVSSREEADVVIARIETPYEAKDDYIIERFMRLGRLYYTEEEQTAFLDVIGDKPSIAVVNLDRPAILTEFDPHLEGLLGEFGCSDQILADLLFGKHSPTGKLPFELPSSWEAVERQLEDVPYDSEDPLYAFGHGLTY